MNISISLRAAVLAALTTLAASVAGAATINTTLGVSAVNKTMSDGKSVTFWVFGPSGGGGMGGGGMGGGGGGGTLPGPQVEVGVGDTLNLTLSMMMAPMEPMPYQGHTIHLHGADVSQAEDGVPETGASVMGDTYTFSPDNKFAGSLIYHCHVHTVKHLEMGMYGALVVRPKDAAGNFLNQITASSASAYDYIQTYLFSSVDPAYHTATGDSTVFADYNPKYFLISGNEGKSTSAPALTLATAVNKKVALRLIGVHSVNGTFSLGGTAFTVYSRDGRPLTTPQTVTSLDIAPGQRADIMFTTPSTSGAIYPQMTFKKLRDGSTFATAYGKVTF